MKNYIQSGQTMPYTAPSGGIAAGAVVISNKIVGIAASSGAEGTSVQVNLGGVYELAKAAGAVAQGALVYWAAGAGNVTTTSSGNTLIGRAFAAAADGDTTIQVILNSMIP